MPERRSTSCCPSACAAPSRRSCPRSPSRRSSATTTGSRKRNFDLDTGFYPLGSCTMKHNPKLHERVAALPGNARLHPLQAPARAQGALELMWELQERAGRDRRACRTSRSSRAPARTASSPACCSPAPTTRTAASTRTKVLTPDTAHGTNPATVTMAGYEVVKVGTDDRRRRRPRRPARQGRRRRRLPDAHQPEHARAVRPATSRRSRAIVHDAGATLYYDGANLNAVMGMLAARRHGLRHRPLQPAQDVHPAARRRRPGRRADRGVRPDRAVPAAPAGRAPRGGNGDGPRSTSTTTGRSRSAACAASRATTASSCAPTPTSCSLGGDGLQEASETAVLNANYLLARLQGAGRGRAPAGRLRPPLHARVRALRRADEARARARDARPRQAPARLRLPPADRLLPAAGRRGAAGRADRDRDARRRSTRFAEAIARDPARGAPRTRRSPRNAPTPRRSAGSTRPARPSARSSASRCGPWASSPASSPPGASTSATTSARSSSTSRARTAATRRSTASSTCTRIDRRLRPGRAARARSTTRRRS